MRSWSGKADGSTPWVVDHWSEKTWIDYLFTGLIVTAYFLATTLAHRGDRLGSISSDQRLAVYGTGATIVSIVGGLSVIAITIYITANGERARAVRATYGKGMRRNWRALFVGLGLSSLSCLVAQAIDGKNDPLSSRILFVAAMVFAAWRFLRLLWLFDALIGVMDRDLTDTGRLPAPVLGNAWKDPEQPLAGPAAKLRVQLCRYRRCRSSSRSPRRRRSGSLANHPLYSAVRHVCAGVGGRRGFKRDGNVLGDLVAIWED